jgi:hypothetical protein
MSYRRDRVRESPAPGQRVTAQISNCLQWEIDMTMRHSLEGLTPFLMLTGVFVVGLAVAAVLARVVGAIVLYILHAF